MKTPLVPIQIMSIYKLRDERVLLPKRMADCTPDTYNAVKGIADDVKKAGGRLFLSDMFRSYDMQLQAHLDWKSGKKSAYSPPPGGSLHEAGRALDLSLRDLKISLQDYWDIAARWGVVPIIATPDSRKKEAWHFECRGSHQKVYEYYKEGKASNMKAYQAMAASSILAIGVNVDKFNSDQQEAYLQACLIRLGFELGNIDGKVGRKTRKAIEEAGIDSENPDEIVRYLEEKLQEKFPGEYTVSTVHEERLFDFDTPEHIRD